MVIKFLAKDGLLNLSVTQCKLTSLSWWLVGSVHSAQCAVPIGYMVTDTGLGSMLGLVV